MNSRLYRVTFRHWDAYRQEVKATSAADAIETLRTQLADNGLSGCARHDDEGTEEWFASVEAGAP